MIHTIEGGTEVKHTKQGQFTLISSDQCIQSPSEERFPSSGCVGKRIDFPAGRKSYIVVWKFWKSQGISLVKISGHPDPALWAEKVTCCV